jgi:hypothetical protein
MRPFKKFQWNLNTYYTKLKGTPIKITLTKPKMDCLLYNCLTTLVVIKVITCCGISLMSLLMTSWTILVIWIPTICGVYIGGMIGHFGTKWTYLGT